MLATQPCITVTANFYDVPFCSTCSKDNMFIYLHVNREATVEQSLFSDFLRYNKAFTLENHKFKKY